MPTTRLRQRISRLGRSSGLVDEIRVNELGGENFEKSSGSPGKTL